MFKVDDSVVFIGIGRGYLPAGVQLTVTQSYKDTNGYEMIDVGFWSVRDTDYKTTPILFTDHAVNFRHAVDGDPSGYETEAILRIPYGDGYNAAVEQYWQRRAREVKADPYAVEVPYVPPTPAEIRERLTACIFERAELKCENAELYMKLAAVTAERDALQTQLDMVGSLANSNAREAARYRASLEEIIAMPTVSEGSAYLSSDANEGVFLTIKQIIEGVFKPAE